MPRRRVNNLLGLAVLAFLMMGRPTHPYEMATLLRKTGKEQDMKIKWGSFYTVIENLAKHGLIEPVGSDRDGRRPERTRYAITDEGRAEVRDWLRELVSFPETEANQFEAALSVLGVLSPDEVTEALETRMKSLEAAIAGTRSALAASGAAVPRIFLIEAEYALAMREAELAWVRGLTREIAEGTLTGVAEWREYHRTGQMPAELMTLLYEGITDNPE
jgi:DNA-binding PadR family transcriptional regulator